MYTTLIKSVLKALILCLEKGPEKNSILLDLNKSISDKEKSTSIAKKLFDAIEECQSPIKSINRVTDLNTQLSKEIYLFTSECGRGKYLEAAHMSQYVNYKIRSDDMLDTLIFLKNYLKQ